MSKVYSLSNTRSGVRLWQDSVSAAAITDGLILVGAMAAGLVLRLWQFNQLGFNTDEAVYAGQAAGIIDDPSLKPFFPVFRAHPMLFQFLVSIGFRFGVEDWIGRLLAVIIGLATVLLVYQLGTLLYGRRAGVFAALLLALMPYHVIISRQMLLDGPMTFCTTLTLYALARFAKTQKGAWLCATGVGLGLTFLTKETGMILAGAVFAFLALSPEIRVRIRDLALALACMVLLIATFPVSLALAGGAKTAQSYLIWQLFRRPNHDWDFYLTNVPVVMGLLLILVAALGLWMLRRERTWREKLLLAWIVVPVVFFQLWPTKGFQYLLPIAPAIAVLAARTLSSLTIRRFNPLRRWRFGLRWAQAIAVIVLALTLLLPSWNAAQASSDQVYMAGTGGIPGGRESGLWIRDNVPQGARMITIGPSMANVLQFYGHRKAYALSVSPNPLRRNPSYDPVVNPDLQIRTSQIQYLVWDSFSATRSPFFAQSLQKYIDRYQGRVIHTETVPAPMASGGTAQTPVIVIYEVHP
jgi:4-amino-4-deoxy-L-arabinose transferase-like glycosyltransferase